MDLIKEGLKRSMSQPAKAKPTHTPKESIDMPMTTKTSGKLVAVPDDVFNALKSHKPSFIVEAVNNYERLKAENAELIQTLKTVIHKLEIESGLNEHDYGDTVNFIKEAITKAEGNHA